MTSGVEALLVIYAALSPEEQEEAHSWLRTLRVEAQDEAEREMDTYLRSLRRVAETIGHTPGVPEYKKVSAELRKQGEDIEPFTRLYRYFGTSWARAQEALELSGETRTKAIEARFAHRRLGKPRRYSEDELRDALAACVAHFGRVPSTGDYSWWRERQLELARSQRRDRLHLPTDGPYRERWGGWEPALLHFGYTPDTRAHQHARRKRVLFAEDEPHLPEGLPVAKLAPVERCAVPLSNEEAVAVWEAYEAFSRAHTPCAHRSPRVGRRTQTHPARRRRRPVPAPQPRAAAPGIRARPLGGSGRRTEARTGRAARRCHRQPATHGGGWSAAGCHSEVAEASQPIPSSPQRAQRA